MFKDPGIVFHCLNASIALPYPIGLPFGDYRTVGAMSSTNKIGIKPARSIYCVNPTHRRQPSSVLLRSIAIVIGPTPPGTGVIAETFDNTAS